MIVGDSITEGSSGDYTGSTGCMSICGPTASGRTWLAVPLAVQQRDQARGSETYANPRFEHANDATWE
jgi:hypothetical protein